VIKGINIPGMKMPDMKSTNINWPKVQKDGYFGLSISPYIRSRRDRIGFWYNGWDVSSQVIWDHRAIKSHREVPFQALLPDFYNRSYGSIEEYIKEFNLDTELNVCYAKDCINKGDKRCSECKTRKYCCSACQKKDWPHEPCSSQIKAKKAAATAAPKPGSVSAAATAAAAADS